MKKRVMKTKVSTAIMTAAKITIHEYFDGIIFTSTSASLDPSSLDDRTQFKTNYKVNKINLCVYSKEIE